MLKRKCPACAEKVERKFSYCPYCGASFKARQEKNNFGMLGCDDSGDRARREFGGHDSGEPDLKLPFGMEKMMNSLIKQLEKQMGNMDFGDGQGMPKGIKIRVARGPQMGQMAQVHQKRKIESPVVSEEENERRAGLPKVDAESKVRRLADSIIYEIVAPGIQKKENVVLTELATGLEIKAYSNEKCYVKFIPLKVEVIGYRVGKEKVFVEFRG